MTDSTQPETPFDDSSPVEQPEIPGAVEAVTPPKGRRSAAQKKADEKAAAEAAEAAAVVADSKPEKGSLYLPSLPKGYAYTTITATGHDGETLTVGPDDLIAGDFTLNFEGAGLKRSVDYPSMDTAIKGLSQAAKNMAKVAARRAELEQLEKDALEF